MVPFKQPEGKAAVLLMISMFLAYYAGEHLAGRFVDPPVAAQFGALALLVYYLFAVQPVRPAMLGAGLGLLVSSL